MKPPHRSFWIWSSYVVAFAAILSLLFFRLDNRALWGDEAETATLARNVLAFGYPRTIDGLNHISLYGPAVDGNADLAWIWSPWLQEYVAAGAYAIFGVTTWASRAPFALIAWFSVVLLAFAIHKIYRNHLVTLSGVLLLGSSELFLLHARQARYYSVSVFAEIVLVLGIYQALRRRPSSVAWLAAALIIQFYGNYIVAFANIPALLVLGWTIYRRHGGTASRFVPAALCLAGLAALPWLLYASPWKQLGLIGEENPIAKVWDYTREFHFHFVPLVFCAPPLAAWFVSQVARRPLPAAATDRGDTTDVDSRRLFERHLLLLIPLYLGAILIAPGWFLRYLLPILPVACLLASVWTFRHVKWPAVAAAVVLIQCSSNLIAVATGFASDPIHRLRSPIADFAGSITHSYRDRFTAVLDYLNKEAKPGQTLLVLDPELPLVFYTRLRVIDGRVNQAALADGSGPDWVLAESASGVAEVRIRLPPEVLQHYETLAVEVPNSVRGGSMPEPDTYEYRTEVFVSRFIIFRKRAMEGVR